MFEFFYTSNYFRGFAINLRLEIIDSGYMYLTINSAKIT